MVPAENESGWFLEIPGREGPITLLGDDALHALRVTLPRANLGAGKKREVEDALSWLELHDSPVQVLRTLAEEFGNRKNTDPEHHRFRIDNWGPVRPFRVSTAKPMLRIALEIAANEEVERRALQGELTVLEREWSQAEELAKISDDLLLPPGVEEWIDRIRKSRAK
jgi:hypothetical protein